MSASAARKCQGLHSPNCGSADCSFHSALLHSACALSHQPPGENVYDETRREKRSACMVMMMIVMGANACYVVEWWCLVENSTMIKMVMMVLVTTMMVTIN